MNQKSTVHQFLEHLEKALGKETFVKLTLSKQVGEDKSFQNIYVRKILLKDQEQLSFTYHYDQKDETQNFDYKKGLAELYNLFGSTFLNGDLFTTEQNIQIRFNRRRQATLFIKKASHKEALDTTHDHKKSRMILAEGQKWLHKLGITDKDGKVLAKGQKKYRQINKYIEIIDSLLKTNPLESQPVVVDMGSGKGYLTFALHEYLTKQKEIQPEITGIELRENLVEKGNKLVEEMGAEGLTFVAQDINEFDRPKIDLLIALHACDTATDLAIAKGIHSNASIIIVAPCCHKQIRKQMTCQSNLKEILKHGILKERQAELVTDGIRALLLEANGYKTKVFEFVSTEHTAKNLMIVGTKGKINKSALEKVEAIKKEFGIDYHYLEKLI